EEDRILLQVPQYVEAPLDVASRPGGKGCLRFCRKELAVGVQESAYQRPRLVDSVAAGHLHIEAGLFEIVKCHVAGQHLALLPRVVHKKYIERSELPGPFRRNAHLAYLLE